MGNSPLWPKTGYGQSPVPFRDPATRGTHHPSPDPICLARSPPQRAKYNITYSLHLASFKRSGLIPRPDEISGLGFRGPAFP